jgi:hypothetical protein
VCPRAARRRPRSASPPSTLDALRQPRDREAQDRRRPPDPREADRRHTAAADVRAALRVRVRRRDRRAPATTTAHTRSAASSSRRSRSAWSPREPRSRPTSALGDCRPRRLRSHPAASVAHPHARERASDPSNARRPRRTTSSSAGRDCSSSTKPALCGATRDASPAAGLDDEEEPARHGKCGRGGTSQSVELDSERGAAPFAAPLSSMKGQLVSRGVGHGSSEVGAGPR